MNYWNQAVCFLQGSIISKKAAEQLDVLVLDIKFGIGAFMKEKSRAKALAEKMVGINLPDLQDCDKLKRMYFSPLWIYRQHGGKWKQLPWKK